MRLGHSPEFNWRRNLYVVWFAEVLSFMALTAMTPLLPYYAQVLGVTSPGQVELWSGLLSSAPALTMAIMAPVWGSLADRLGRKLMLERAMFGGALVLGAMALVTNVQQLLLLRILQGAVTGTVAASFTLIAAGTPGDQRALALGFVQMGVYLGGSLGPVLGGAAADVLGYRVSFLVAATLLLVGGMLAAALARDVRSDLVRKQGNSFVQELGLVLRSPDMLSVLALRSLISSAWCMVSPMLPLFVQELVPARARLGLVAGLVTSTHMATAAVGAVVMGRIGHRLGARKVLLAALAGSGVCYLLQAMVSTVAQLLLLTALAGLALGGILTSSTAALAKAAPEGRQGAVFGLDSSVQSAANAATPMLSAAIAVSWGLRTSFLAASLGFALATGMLMVRKPSRKPNSLLSPRS